MPSQPHNASPKRMRRLTKQGIALKAARERLGLSQPGAAKALDIAVATYRSWEHGLRQPSPEAREKLIAEWQVDPKLLGTVEDGRCPHCGRHY